MKDLNSGLEALITSDLATLCTCWKLELVDGRTFGFTDHDKTLSFDGVTYRSETAYTGTAIATRADYSVDDIELAGLLDSDIVSEADIDAGLLDYADVTIFLVNYLDTSNRLAERRGKLGQVTTRKNGMYYTEIRGLIQLLQQQIGAVIQPTCRAEFGSTVAGGTPVIKACEFDLDTVKEVGAVTSVEGRRYFTDTSRGESEGHFNLGKITFTSGDNAGYSKGIKAFGSSQFELVDPLPYDVSVGDEYEVWPGCDKTPLTCRDTYDNLINFRGNPFVPGLDKTLRVSDSPNTASVDEIYGPSS